MKEIDIMNLPDYPVPKDDALKAINIKENKVDVEMKGTVSEAVSFISLLIILISLLICSISFLHCNIGITTL